ncbi:hypothetical protein F1847_06325 [Thermodesulfobacterium sp. TA1]|uniref:hypothetical protein n=1 Tax=Thermodesulfobacterium sp. TA1 TaxID=2234087 RepID=UPI001232AD21|nr:hypothetical protein [Thermodesulfobacterium sp. TA1]QER42377.1 hypothetical protein F1847_06325 [Thermodesulfobacterium sp. TA1]
MVRKELIELKETLEKEKRALMKGAVEEILKWASYKARLANFLKDKDFTKEEQEMLKEIFQINEKNKLIIQAGLNFVEEAYSFLSNMLCQQKTTYGKVSHQSPRVISKSA